MSNYSPAAGRAFIEPEQRFTTTGALVIPEYLKRQKKAVAKVTAWKPGYRMRCECGHVQHLGGACRACQSRKLKIISDHPTAPFSIELAGKRVIYAETAVSHIHEETYVIPIDDIIAIIPDDMELDNAEDEGVTPRCKACGPCQEGSQQGMLMVWRKGRYVCPRCMRSQRNELVDLIK